MTPYERQIIAMKMYKVIKKKRLIESKKRHWQIENYKRDVMTREIRKKLNKRG